MNAVVTLTPNPALDQYVEVDELLPDEKLRTTLPRVDPGGGGVNVSRMVRRFGCRTVAVTTAGGPTGSALLEALQAEGVPAAALAIGGSTRMSFVARSRKDGHLYRFVTPGPTLTGDDSRRLLALLEEKTGPGDILVGSGSLPPGLADGFWAEAVEVAKRKAATMILDSLKGAREALEAGVAVLRLNRIEQRALSGKEASWPNGVAAWAEETRHRFGTRAVIVTHGADGALMATEEGIFRAVPPPVRTESAVGAGDSFVAGVSYALLRKETPQDALKWGVAAAAATMQTPGTELCTREGVEALRRQMT